MNVLIVDDEMTIVKSTSMYLKTKGYTDVNTLTDSRLVLDFINLRKPNVILLDLNMPYINGETLLEKFKALSLNIHIIVISAVDDIDTINRCIKLGASEYLVKPIDNSSLISSLQNI